MRSPFAPEPYGDIGLIQRSRLTLELPEHASLHEMCGYRIELLPESQPTVSIDRQLGQ